jgi:DNA-binding transcriptional ArsR family regulator
MDTPPRDMTRELADLTERVRRLEARDAPGAPSRELSLAGGLIEASAAGTATVVTAGAGPWEGGTVAWKMRRSWQDVRGSRSTTAAAVFAALSSPTRVEIVRALLDGPLPTSALSSRIDASSTGRLFHHLKELLGAGLVHQPVRGTYALRRTHVVPLLAALSCALDLAGPDAPEEDR